MKTSLLLCVVLLSCLSGLYGQRVLNVPTAGGNSQNGVMFDLQATAEVLVTGFDLYLSSSDPTTIEVWKKTSAGGFVGSETNPAAWTRVARFEGIIAPNPSLPVALPRDLRISINSGSTQAIYLTTTGTNTLSYTNGTAVGAVAAADAFVALREGAGVQYPFGANFRPRVFRGSVIYRPVRRVPGSAATIQGAINLANNDEAIRVAPGTYGGGINLLGKRLLVWSPTGPATTTIDANFFASGVTMTTGETAATELDGFRIIEGRGAASRGGGIHLDEASPVLRNLWIEGCRGGAPVLPGAIAGAGGLHCNGSVGPTLRNVRIDDCEGGASTLLSGFGGPGGVFVQLELLARDLEITNCRGGAGGLGRGGVGGIEVRSLANVPLDGLVLRGNQGGNGAVGGTGGLYTAGDSATRIDRALIAGNVGGVGSNGDGGTGGVHFWNGGSRITASLLRDNRGGSATGGRGGAGALAFEGDTGARALHCTLTRNTPGTGSLGNGPGGIHFLRLLISDVRISNAIISANAGAEIATVPAAGPNGSQGLLEFTLIEGGYPGPGNLDAPALFVNPANDDFRLQAASPAFDTGSNAPLFLPEKDLDGNAFGQWSARDLGCYEITRPFRLGTADDLLLQSFVFGQETFRPNLFDIVEIRLTTTTGSFLGIAPYLVAQAFTSANPPSTLASIGIPEIQMDAANLQILVDPTLFPGPFGPPVLGPSLAWNFRLGSSAPGVQVRLQGFLVSSAAANGVYAASNVVDLVLP